MARRAVTIALFLVLAACLPEPLPRGTPASPVETPPPAAITETSPPTATAVEDPSNTPTSSAVPPTTPAETAAPTIPPVVNELPGSELLPGFSIVRFAEIYRPTAIAFDAQGRMLVTSVDNRVYLLADSDGDGRADRQSIFASGFLTPLGVTVNADTGDVFVSYQGAIARLRDTDGDGEADQRTDLFSGLPFGRHQNDNLKFGLDGLLYMGVGSTCDACFEADSRSATIMRFDVDTLQSEVFATGLRNPYDLAFHPLSGELFATDNGRDDLGLDAPQEELNLIVEGGNYGFPGCWDLHDQNGCEEVLAPVAFFESHSSANGLDFNRGGPFPEEFFGNAFVSIFGSFLKPDVQTGVQRVVLVPTADGYASETDWFVRFPAGVMPLPLLFGPDGALYVGDYLNDAIYRISYGVP